MQVARFIGMIKASEQQLADAFLLVANRHEREAGVRDMCKQLSGWSLSHVEKLRRFEERFGEQASEEPARVRSALFHGMRIGGIGLLRDMQDLMLLANQSHTFWTSLSQAANSLHDKDLEQICAGSLEEVERQMAWIETQIKHAAPQAIIVAADKGSEVSASLPKTPTAAATPDVMWAPLAAGLLMLAVGVAALAAGRPFLIPSLGPTAYLQATEPAHPSSRLYNTAVGHLVGLGAGFLAVAILGSWDAPAVLTDHQLVALRMWAAVIALAVTVFICLLLKSSHPPAGATTLLVALGSIKTMADAVNVAIGVVLIAILGEAIRRLRLKMSAPRSV